ncbi:CAP domain-containing protein [Arenibaculum pallidiluteum]|uniref:CAP domain-containing protein n=1 Tax=Arenibaculum pallidiluteum TaxID=2812559 RepID=UPI001A96F585|nr:CAP domain-containing protein [Arenibaculum pallidiluteum]
MSEPTALEQYMLELVNRARANPSAEAARLGIDLNQGVSTGFISTAAKQPLAFNQDLIDAARKHSAWMLDTDTFSHTGVNGSSPGDRMVAEGYAFSGSWRWAENIAITWGARQTPNQQVVDGLEDGLFKSPGHRLNIMNADVREIGVGIAAGEYKGSPGVTATQAFAKSGVLPFLTGVAFDDRDGDHFYDPGEGSGGVHVQARSATGQVFETDTWSAGGWQMPVPQGTYTLTFSGGGLAAPVVKTAVVGTSNVKVDLDADIGQPAQTAPSPAPAPTPAPGPVAAGVVRAGTAGPDAITGTDGADKLSGLAGNDTLQGGAGDDLLYGDAGADQLHGGTGSDRLYGRDGADLLFGNDGADWLVGGFGGDRLTGGTGADRFTVQSLNDRGDLILDFTLAQGDRLDLSELMDRQGYGGANPFADGTLVLVDTAAGARLDVHVNSYDVAGLVTFSGIAAADLDASAFLV